MIRENEKIISSLLFWMVLLFPIWWVTGLKLFIFQLFSLILFLYVLLNNKKRGEKTFLSVPSLILFLFSLVYIASILLNINSSDPERVFGSIYNLTFWLMGVVLLITFNNVNYNEFLLKKLSLAFRINGLIISSISVVALIYWQLSPKRLEFNTLLSFIIPNNSSLLYDTLNPLITREDWLFEQVFPRLSTLFLYPTALGMGISFCIFMTLIYHKINKTNYKLKYIELALMLIPLFFSFTRIVIIGLLFSLLLVMVFEAFFKKNKTYLYFSFYFVAFMFFILLSINYFNDIYYLLFESREGSTSLRLYVYNLAINHTLENNLILGVGVKPYLESLSISIGSHSTFVGVFLRTGILGFILYIFFLISIFFIVFKTRFNLVKVNDIYVWKWLSICYINFVFWMMTEDIDVPQNISFMFFILVIILIMLNKKGENYANNNIVE